jgi:hypothetical protein
MGGLAIGNKSPDERYSETESVRRREDALKRILTTPHQPP